MQTVLSASDYQDLIMITVSSDTAYFNWKSLAPASLITKINELLHHYAENFGLTPGRLKELTDLNLDRDCETIIVPKTFISRTFSGNSMSLWLGNVDNTDSEILLTVPSDSVILINLDLTDPDPTATYQKLFETKN